MIPYTQFEQLNPEDTFRFECRNCGDCCRNVAHAVMIESLDLFRIARHLNVDVAEAAEQCAEAITIDWGAPILALKTKPARDVCVFLKSGKCGIQPSKPRACRLYPLSVGPDDKDINSFIILKSPERTFHYSGQEYRAQEWVDANFDQEAREYIITEYKALREFGKILRQIPREREDAVNWQMLRYRYFLFETDRDFIPQYVLNMARLKLELQALAVK